MYDFLIVGAGVSGVALFRQLVVKAIESGKTISICLMGDEQSFGTGQPYRTDQSDILRINDYADNLSLHPDNKFEFLEWAFLNPSISEKYNFKVEKEGSEYKFNNDYPPRLLYGYYFQSVLDSTLEKAHQHGFEIKILKCCASSVAKISIEDRDDRKSMWQVYSVDGKEILTKKLILATGQLPSEKFNDFYSIANFHPAFSDKISQIDKTSTVAILGSRLTAYDSIRLLLLGNHHIGKIILVSQSGLIAHVKNYRKKPADTIQMKYMTVEKILEQQTNLTLDYVLSLFNQELSEHLGVEFCLDSYLRQEAALNMVDRLKQGLKYNAEKKVLITISPILHHIYFSIFPVLCKFLPENQLVQLINRYYAPFLRHVYTIPLMTAQLMSEACDRGQLSFHGGIGNIEFINGSFLIQTKNEPITANHIIDATGPGKLIAAAPLLSQMSMDGFICQHPYSGIRVNPESLMVLNHEQAPQDDLYAIGVVTFGSNLSVYSIVGCVKQSVLLADQLISEISHLHTAHHIGSNHESTAAAVCIQRFFRGYKIRIDKTQAEFAATQLSRSPTKI